ncbi:hypothetical protein P9112_006267 [Eukaryota sp. TZLM1-RC]
MPSPLAHNPHFSSLLSHSSRIVPPISPLTKPSPLQHSRTPSTLNEKVDLMRATLRCIDPSSTSSPVFRPCSTQRSFAPHTPTPAQRYPNPGPNQYQDDQDLVGRFSLLSQTIRQTITAPSPHNSTSPHVTKFSPNNGTFSPTFAAPPTPPLANSPRQDTSPQQMITSPNHPNDEHEVQSNAATVDTIETFDTIDTVDGAKTFNLEPNHVDWNPVTDMSSSRHQKVKNTAQKKKVTMTGKKGKQSKTKRQPMKKSVKVKTSNQSSNQSSTQSFRQLNKVLKGQDLSSKLERARQSLREVDDDFDEALDAVRSRKFDSQNFEYSRRW